MDVFDLNHPPVAPVLILDFGSQYTQLIARRIRELNVFSMIVPGDVDKDRVFELNPQAIIFSGGPSSVYDEGAPRLSKGLLEEIQSREIPLLGICYGMQLLVHNLGGKVEGAKIREYGPTDLFPEKDSKLFSIWGEKANRVWMSHGDETKALPGGFKIAARSKDGGVSAIES
ncbi:MAG: gamma-glutamyl-gamma-aminobutyrate hydrolase family protein, partial [Bdellovibrionales bacterium]|nr:gamma-glutamyl-gamma-aminobutyrate hydrolase family protein [Bdellovibrionales bacterium]